jgi:methylmalonyl-CoA/ethylmalonyl-CoA epimerase
MATLKLETFKLDHIGVVVNDIQKAVDFYTKAFGIKFDDIAEHQLPPDVITRGKPSPYTMKVTFGPMSSSVRLELIQIVEGKTLQSEFLKAHGEGIMHLGYEVENLEKEVANAESQGLEVISFLKMVGIMAFAYLDSAKTHGVMIELVQKDVRDKIMKKLSEGG